MKKIILIALSAVILVSCSKNGDPGPQGNKGDTGAQGPKGDKGDQGEPGTDGSNGTDGADGAPGAPGSVNAYSYLYQNQSVTSLRANGKDANNNFIFLGTKNYKPANYARIANTGAVLIYLRDKNDLRGTWNLGGFKGLSFVSDGAGPSGSIAFNAVSTTDFVEVTGTETSTGNSNQYLKNYKFDVKIILLESTSVIISAIKNGRLNLHDVAAVERLAAPKTQ